MILISLVVTACGGGGSSSGGIDGTGAPAQRITTAGTVENNNSQIEINDIQYDISGADVSVDGQSASNSSLEQGQVIVVDGEVPEGDLSQTVDARTVSYLSNVIGPIEQIDSLEFNIQVLGQTVQLNPSTIYGSGLDNFESLVHASTVRISGLVDSLGAILATRVDLVENTTEFQVVGMVSELNTDSRTFMLNQLRVNYSEIDINFSIALGQVIRVNGIELDAENGVLNASNIELVDNISARPESLISLDGFVTRYGSFSDFDVNGISFSIEDISVIENGNVSDLGLDARIEVLAQINDQGIAIPSKIVIVNTAPIRFSGFLSNLEEARFVLHSSADDVGLWLTLDLDGGADLEVRNEQGTLVCASREVSLFNDGFCYLNTNGEESFEVFILSYADTNYELTGYFRRAEFGPVEVVEAGVPVPIFQYAGDRNLYRISAANAPLGSLLAVKAEGLENGGRLLVNANGMPESNVFSCQLNNNFFSQVCWLDIAGSDEWFLTIESAAENAITLYADFIVPQAIEDDVAQSGSIDYRQGALYRFIANSDERSIAAIVESPSGPINLLTNGAAPPSLFGNACLSSPFSTSDVQCISETEGQSLWYILLQGELNTTYNVSVLAQSQDVPTQNLAIGSRIEVDQDAAIIARYQAPRSGPENVFSVHLEDLSDTNYELRIKDNQAMNDENDICIGAATDRNSRICRAVNSTQDDTWNLVVKSAFSGRYALTTYSHPVIDLDMGVQRQGEITVEYETTGIIYRVPVTPDDRSVSLSLFDKVGRSQFYAKKDFVATELSNECSEIDLSTLDVSCTIDADFEGYWYILVKGDLNSRFTIDVDVE